MTDPSRAAHPVQRRFGRASSDPDAVKLDPVRSGHGSWLAVPSEAVRPGDRRRRRTGLLVAIVVAVALQLWGIYRPTPPPSEPGLPHLDKVFHAGSFALPVILLLLLIGRIHLLVVAVFALHAVISEVIQAAFYTQRAGDPTDTLADLIGTALGVAIFALIARRRPVPRAAAKPRPRGPGGGDG